MQIGIWIYWKAFALTQTGRLWQEGPSPLAEEPLIDAKKCLQDTWL